MGADEAFNRAPSAMKGVFVGDACVYNAAGGYYVGEVEKGKIRMGLKQVKQGEKGKYGEIVGRELTGKFVASTAPIYIWMRKDGTLELISGRHRFAKAMEDGEVKSVMCYVFREDAKHNELWAELLDYENNLRDDQADERTAAYYVRKFPQTDEELRAKGLLRNGTVAKRGIFIGRYARENLYNMWMSTDPRLPLGRATNIEEICRMTKDIKDVSRIEDIQSTAARLLGEGESWEYINGMIHMMAQDRTAELRQGLLDMGTDYTQNLERAARYIEKVVKDLEAGIKQIKDFMANKGMARGSSARKRAKSAEAVGLDAGNLKYPEEKLAALTEAAEQWKMVGNYPELVSEAYMWDGETEVEKAGRICSRVEAEQDAAVEAGERARAQAEVPEGQGEMSFSAAVVVRNKLPEGMTGEAAVERVYEMAAENAPVLGRIAHAVVARLGEKEEGKKRKGRVEMRPGLKSRVRALEKAHNDYGGDISRVIDITGGTLVMADDSAETRAAVMEELEKVLAEEGCSVARVKEFGFKGKGYRDMKLSIEFANGGVGEMIVISDFMFRMKMGCGHVLYEVQRTLDPYIDTDPAIKEAHDRLKDLEEEVYTEGGSAANLERAYARASSSLQGLPFEKINAFLSSRDMSSVKSPDSGSNLATPPNVNSPATPSSSEILKLIDKLSIAIKEEISKRIIEENERKLNGEGWTSSVEEGRNLGVLHVLGTTKLRMAEELGGMPVPSVAVTRLDKPYKWGGNGSVILVGRPEMVDPERGARVYERDAWTGTMPEMDTLMYEPSSLLDPDNPDERMYFLVDKGHDEYEPWLATPENLEYYMSKTKKRGAEARGMGKDPLDMARALTARQLRNMEEVKGMREKLESFDGEDVMKSEVRELDEILREKYDLSLSREQWYAVFDAVADVEEVNEENVRHALNWWEDEKGQIDLADLTYSDALDKGSEWLGKLVDVLKRLRAEKRDYLEATPLRTVKLNEWRYALVSDIVPEGLREKVRGICERNGIEYREYEEGKRDEALAELVGNDVSFSVEDLYHATPHDFGEFKMGRALKSGEGNQSFGAGVYLAQSKVVNKVYWDRFFEMFYVDRRGRLYRTGTKWGTGKITETKSGRELKAGDARDVRQYILDGEARRARMEKLRGAVERAREEAAAARAKAQPAREEAAGRIPERAAEEDRLVKKAWMEWVERAKAQERAAGGKVVKDWGALTEVGRYYESQIPWKLLGRMKRAGIEEPPMDVERAFAAIRRVNGYKGWREARVEAAGRKWEVEAEAAEARGRKAAEGLEALEEIEELGLEGFLPNNLRVRFEAEADEMIDWDIAGTASTRKLKEAMGEVEWGLACLGYADAARESSFYTWARKQKGRDKETIRKAVERAIEEGKSERERVGKIAEWLGVEGKEVRKALREGYEGEEWVERMTGKQMYWYISRTRGGDVEASRWCVKHGVYGTKYLDGESRKHPERVVKTYNYVVFDPGRAVITHRSAHKPYSMYRTGNVNWEAVEVMTDEELSSAVVGIDDRVMGILRARDAEEAMGARIAGEWGKFARAVSLSTASGDEWRAEDGARLMGKMLGLVAATRRFLPEEYGAARGMHQMLAWGKWYAQVLESGEVKRTDMLRGEIYEKALAGMRREVEGMRGRLTPGEVEGWLRGQMGQRLDVMLLKMAAICRGQVERYEKEQIRQRMMDMAERLYPKMEPGEHIKRGKATADTYRYIERVVRTVRGDMWWKSGAAAAEMEAALAAKLARVDLDPKTRAVVERELAELRSKEWQSVEDEIEARERVVDNAEGIYTEEEQKEAGEVIHVLQTYGNWRRMGIEECRKAYEEFRQVVVEGKRKWEAALERRKSELEYVKKKVRAVKGWKSGVVNERVGENAKKASEGKDVVKLTAMALTTFTGKLQAAKRKLGGFFVERETNMIAEMHRELKLKSDEAHNWVLEQLVKCSGERTRAGVEDWLRRMNEIEDTGIKLKLKQRHVYTITKEKLAEWARMPREKWAGEIERRQAVAEAEERVDTEIPTLEALEELVPEMVNDEVRGARKQKYVYIWETENETPLRGTKMGVLQAILTAEQPYYEHLLEDNGVSAEVLAQMREYVGGELLALGYALRDRLAEEREALAAMHERIYGVPFPGHENYYPGKFLVESDNGAQGDGKVAQRSRAGISWDRCGYFYGWQVMDLPWGGDGYTMAEHRVATSKEGHREGGKNLRPTEENRGRLRFSEVQIGADARRKRKENEYISS